MSKQYNLIGALKRMPDHFMVIMENCCPTITGTIRRFGPKDLKHRYSYLEIQRTERGDDSANPINDYDVVDSWSGR